MIISNMPWDVIIKIAAGLIDLFTDDKDKDKDKEA